MSILNRFFRDKKGGANAIIGVVILFLSMLFIMLLIEIGRLYVIAESFKNDLDFANASVWAVVDQERLAYREIQFHKSSETEADGVVRAQNKFSEYLCENMNLSPSFQPNNPDGVIAGPVTLERFEVYLQPYLPLTNSEGIYIDKVSVYSKITVPVKLLFKMFGDTYNLPIIRVTNLEDAF
ncbi:hypothetical protein [Ammoniphilus resinae]|uniref:Flp pilus-assembly TadG-like N-terminal domain-containing protein n=1 Tax=Ammoniphilus resinae TaxID=861532 RepID=A0ABS4GNH0_9BACL|nr:hypothetical protein [Ammoniphilus resinae]MBP1931820.1 hypothetical protein [Ammoniphilus resinae]